MTFDSSINLGQIVEFAGFVFVSISVIVSLRKDVKTLKFDVVSVKNEMKKITDILVQVARQDERINAQDKRIDDLAGRSHTTVVMSQKDGT